MAELTDGWGGFGHALFAWLWQLRLFLDQGGAVLWILAGVSTCIWGLLAEHALWLLRHSRPLAGRARALAAQGSGAWSEYRRRMHLSRMQRRMQRSLPLVRTLVTLCPLLGLLGTVVGMVEVFDTMAVLGGADARALSSGISRAVLTTMAGLSMALPGLYAVNRMERWIDRLLERLTLQSRPETTA